MLKGVLGLVSKLSKLYRLRVCWAYDVWDVANKRKRLSKGGVLLQTTFIQAFSSQEIYGFFLYLRRACGKRDGVYWSSELYGLRDETWNPVQGGVMLMVSRNDFPTILLDIKKILKCVFAVVYGRLDSGPSNDILGACRICDMSSRSEEPFFEQSLT